MLSVCRFRGYIFPAACRRGFTLYHVECEFMNKSYANALKYKIQCTGMNCVSQLTMQSYILSLIRSQITQAIRDQCQCEFQERFVSPSILVCDEQELTQIVYRANISSFGTYSTDQLVGYIEDWVTQGATLESNGNLVVLNCTCPIPVNSTTDLTCPQVTGTPAFTLQSLTPPQSLTPFPPQSQTAPPLLTHSMTLFSHSTIFSGTSSTVSPFMVTYSSTLTSSKLPLPQSQTLPPLTHSLISFAHSTILFGTGSLLSPSMVADSSTLTSSETPLLQTQSLPPPPQSLNPFPHSTILFDTSAIVSPSIVTDSSALIIGLSVASISVVLIVLITLPVVIVVIIFMKKQQ